MSLTVFRDIGVFSETIVNTVPTRAGGALVPAIIGFARDWFNISGEAILRSSLVDVDIPANLITRSLDQVGNSPATSDYVVGVDVQIGTGPNAGFIEWLNNSIGNASIGSITTNPVGVGGSIPDGNNFFIVTAVNANGETDETGAVVGEANILTAGGGLSTVSLSWNVVPGATSYRIYFSAVGGAGNYNNSFLLETVNTSITLLNVTTIAQTPPVASTAFNKPANDATYYVSYSYNKVKSDYAPRFVTSFSDIQSLYGGETINTGSLSSPIYTQNDLGLAASLIFDQGAQGMYVVQLNNVTTLNPINTLNAGSGDGEIRNAYQEGLDLLRSKAAYYIVPLSTDSLVRQKAFDHVLDMSSTDNRGERVTVNGFPNGTNVGDATSPGTMIGIRQGFAALGDVNASRMWLIANGANGAGKKTVRNTDGSATELNITGAFYAAIEAGKQSGQQKITYPINRKPVVGLDSIESFSNEDRLRLQNNGVSVIYALSDTVFAFSRAVTAAVSTIEYIEPTTRQQMDVIVSDMREQLERRFIVEGNAIIDETTPILVQNFVNVILNRNKNDGLISKFFPESTKATQNQDVPTLVDIEYKIKLVYPFLNAFVTQVVSLA